MFVVTNGRLFVIHLGICNLFVSGFVLLPNPFVLVCSVFVCHRGKCLRKYDFFRHNRTPIKKDQGKISFLLLKSSNNILQSYLKMIWKKTFNNVQLIWNTEMSINRNFFQEFFSKEKVWNDLSLGVFLKGRHAFCDVFAPSVTSFMDDPLIVLISKSYRAKLLNHRLRNCITLPLCVAASIIK